MEVKKRKKAIYSRKSKYTGKGESIENQIDTCKHYLKTYIDTTLTDDDIVVYNDEGYTGANTDRPQFQEMMKAIKKDEFDTIICYRLDRVSRNVLDFANLYEDWQEHNVNFISVSERFDTTTPMGKAMLFIAITFAQLERDTIAERIRDNMYKLAKTGRWLGGTTPLGFMSEKMEKLNINGKKTNLFKLVPVDDEINVIKTIFQKFLEYKSQTQVESYLIQNDYKTKRNCDFSRWGVKTILKNPVYATADKDVLQYFLDNEVEVYNEHEQFDGTHGIIGYCKTEKTKTGRVKYKDLQDWIVAIGEHKGIISGKDWVEVQNILKANEDKNYRKPIKNNAILVGVLRCSHCKSLMRAKLKKTLTPNGELRFNYICDLKMKSKGTKCSCKNVNGNEADELVIKGMQELAQPTSEFYKAIKDIATDNDYDNKNKNDELQQLERNYSKNENEIKNLANRLAIVDDEIFDVVQAQMKELKRKNNEIAKNIQKLKQEQPNQVINDQETAKIVFEILNSYMSRFNELDIISKRNLIKLFVGNMETDGKNIYMDLIGSRNHTLTTKPQLFDKNDENNVNQEGLSATHNGQIVLSSDSSECGYHLKELYVVINELFSKISSFCELSFTLTTHTCRQVKNITSKSTLGEQIKYYRSIDDIKQTDLGLKLNFNRSTLNHLENKDIKLVNIKLIKGIIEELGIEDKININDDYISFLLDNPCEKILSIRKKKKLTRQEFADLIGVSISSVRRWELGNSHIGRKKFERLKKFL